MEEEKWRRKRWMILKRFEEKEAQITVLSKPSQVKVINFGSNVCILIYFRRSKVNFFFKKKINKID